MTFCADRQHIAARTLFSWMVCLVLTTVLEAVPLTIHAAGLEIAILKSSDLKAYNEAIEGFKATAPGAAIFAEYDLRGDLERGKQLARKIRTSDTSVVVAVGLTTSVPPAAARAPVQPFEAAQVIGP